MTSSVMNRASVVMTWLGGSCCVPIACRKQAQHDDDPHEAGRHQQDGRREAEHRQQQHHLQRRAEPLGLVHDSGPPRRASATGSGKQRRGRERRRVRPLRRATARPAAAAASSTARRRSARHGTLMRFIVGTSRRAASVADEAAVGGLAGELARGPGGTRLASCRAGRGGRGGQVLDFGGVGDFGQRFDAGRRQGDQQQLVADRTSCICCRPASGARPSSFDGFLGQAALRRPAQTAASTRRTTRNRPSTIPRLPATVPIAPRGRRRSRLVEPARLASARAERVAAACWDARRGDCGSSARRRVASGGMRELGATARQIVGAASAASGGNRRDGCGKRLHGRAIRRQVQLPTPQHQADERQAAERRSEHSHPCAFRHWYV